MGASYVLKQRLPELVSRDDEGEPADDGGLRR